MGIFFYFCFMTEDSLRHSFLRHLAPTSMQPLGLEIDRAEGVFLYAGNKRYIDCISGIAVSNLGHNNPYIKEAMIRQMEKHLHLMVYGEIVQQSQVLLAQELAKILPPSLHSVYYTNSGSEAIEGAMKLAKRYTGKSRFVALKNAYHGSTQGALSLMSDAYFSNKFVPLLPGITFIEQNDINAIHEAIDKETAAVFIEPVMGEKGYEPCTPGFLEALRSRCNETGALLAYDEVQSGYGRTGEMFAFRHYGVMPDILVLAKGFGGGMPLGAFISSQDIMSSLADNPVLGHISTFGGHPVSCAASLASLQYIREYKVLEGVQAKEALFRQLLVHPAIKSITGKGLMLALGFEDKETCRHIIDKCVEAGLLVDWFLYAEHKMRLAPPLVIEENEIRAISGIILENISKD